jgi:ubiquitin C-terminal hydrolase
MQRFIATKTDQFNGYNQQDSNEFLIYLLDNIHQESKHSLQSAKPNLKEIAGDNVMSIYQVKHT